MILSLSLSVSGPKKKILLRKQCLIKHQRWTKQRIQFLFWSHELSRSKTRNAEVLLFIYLFLLASELAFHLLIFSWCIIDVIHTCTIVRHSIPIARIIYSHKACAIKGGKCDGPWCNVQNVRQMTCCLSTAVWIRM